MSDIFCVFMNQLYIKKNICKLVLISVVLLVHTNIIAIELVCKKERDIIEKFTHLFEAYKEKSKVEVDCKSRVDVVNNLENAALTIQVEKLGNLFLNDCFSSTQEIRNSDPAVKLQKYYVEGIFSLCNQKLRYSENFHIFLGNR